MASPTDSRRVIYYSLRRGRMNPDRWVAACCLPSGSVAAVGADRLEAVGRLRDKVPACYRLERDWEAGVMLAK